MARFILVHGAWHGGWCWEDIGPRLQSRGHHVTAPDLPGMGADASLGHVASLDEWAMFVAGMAGGDQAPAILVGHSRGGLVISRAAELAPGAVATLIYVAGTMPRAGETLQDLFADHPSPHAPGSVQLAEDRRTSRWVDRETGIAAFYGMTPPDRAAAAIERLTPEPTSMAIVAAVLSAERYGKVPRHYILCERDQAVPPSLQRKMIAAQPCQTYTLDCDHSPFYSAVDDLTDLLDRIGRTA